MKNSGRRDTIRLMKLWKKRKDVPIKTFILEEMIIEGCKYTSRSDLAPQLNAALTFIRDNILTIRLVDPANSYNIISDELTTEQKNRISNLASEAIGYRKWAEVFT